MMSHITLEGDGPFELVAQSAKAIADGDMVTLSLRVLHPAHSTPVTVQVVLMADQAATLLTSLSKAAAQQKAG
jgi:hypothetical protein